MAQRGVKPPLARARSKPLAEDESIYKFADASLQPSVAPRVRTYDVPAVGPSYSGGEALVLPNVRIKVQHADSSQVESVLNPVLSSRDAQVRAGVKPINHSRNNVAAIRDVSQLNQLRRISSLEREKTQKQGFKATPVPVAAVRSTSAPSRRPDVSAESNRDFVSENRIGAGAPAPRAQRASAKPDDAIHREFGRVPQYLLERKIELIEVEEQRAAAKEAALIPPGMRLLGETERQETLAILARNMAEVMRGIQALPFVTETPGQIRRKDELERRLREIEDAQKIFSRPKEESVRRHTVKAWAHQLPALPHTYPHFKLTWKHQSVDRHGFDAADSMCFNKEMDPGPSVHIRRLGNIMDIGS